MRLDDAMRDYYFARRQLWHTITGWERHLRQLDPGGCRAVRTRLLTELNHIRRVLPAYEPPDAVRAKLREGGGRG